MSGWYQQKVVPQLLNSEMGSKELADIRKEVVPNATGTVLELGVGPGYNFALYRNISKLYALEPSVELTEIAKNRAKELSFPIEFLATGAEKIPLSENSVDTVVSTWTLCSVNDLPQVLSEVKRVLKPTGKFLFVDHGASPNNFIRCLQKISTAVTKHFTGNCHYDRKIEKLLIEAGFNIEEMAHPVERWKPLIYNYRGVANMR